MIPALIAATLVLDNLIPVSSSAIAAVGYDPLSWTLRIQFTESGAVYSYGGVPALLYAGLMAAPSKGRFFAENIRDNFPVIG